MFPADLGKVQLELVKAAVTRYREAKANNANPEALKTLKDACFTQYAAAYYRKLETTSSRNDIADLRRDFETCRKELREEVTDFVQSMGEKADFDKIVKAVISGSVRFAFLMLVYLAYCEGLRNRFRHRNRFFAEQRLTPLGEHSSTE